MVFSCPVQFLSWSFPFIAMSKFSRTIFRLFVGWSVNCFPSPFCVLVISVLLMHVLSVLFLMNVISFPLRLNHYIDASTLSWMLKRLRSPSFLDTYNLSVSFLRCKTISIIMTFFCSLVYLFMFSVHFKCVPEYFTTGIAQVFIHSMKFLLSSMISGSFIVLVRYSFIYFLFNLYLFDDIHSQCYVVFVSFLFSERSEFFMIW